MEYSNNIIRSCYLKLKSIHEFSILAKQIKTCLLDPVNAVFRPMVVLIVNIAPDVMICVICRNSETYFMNRMLICSVMFIERYLNGDILKIGSGYSSMWIYHAGSAQRVPDPTCYPTFFQYPTRFSFENFQVTGNPKYWVLPEIVGVTQYFGLT